jgi:hypothetical protein
MKYFPKLTLLNLSQNSLPDSGIKEFGDILTGHVRHLKGLDVAGNIMQFDSQLDLARACANIPSMQWLRLTCMNTMLDEGPNDDNPVGTMFERLKEVMKCNGRDDICVEVVRLSVAILVDLIDFFE